MNGLMKRKSSLIKENKHFLEERKKEFEKYFDRRIVWNYCREDFDFVKLIGVGSLGRVFLVRSLRDRKPYAIKVMEKLRTARRGQARSVVNEKKIIQSLNHPFCVRLEFAFQDPLYVYLAMPFFNGGELFNHLRRLKKYEESWARFYSGQILLAFEYLHYCGLVYRDLKPENLLLDKDGYIKVTDFATCKLVSGRTYTFCGTPEYVAPEMILSQSYTMAVDWWSFGVLIFEMSAGYTPFHARSEVKIYKKAINCSYRSPQHFSLELSDLVKNLLQVDVTKRYGNLKNGVDDLKTHSWYQNLDWLSLLNRKVEPPFKPVTEREDDTRNFVTYDEKLWLSEPEEKIEIPFSDF